MTQPLRCNDEWNGYICRRHTGHCMPHTDGEASWGSDREPWSVSDDNDVVNNPDHYTSGGIECIDYIEAKGLGFHLGNAVKYISRAGRKGDAVEDLRKARWYLDREIARREA